MMQSEMDLQNNIRIYLSQLGYTVFRTNVIASYTRDGRYVPASLPKGFSDLFAVKDGKAIFIEVKFGKNKATKDQINFIEQMQKKGCRAGVVYSIGDVDNLIK